MAATAAARPAPSTAPDRPVHVLPDPPAPHPASARPDVEAFLHGAAALPPLVRHAAGLSAEAREEAVDLCAAAVEKHPADVERCMQVRRRGGCRGFCCPVLAGRGKERAGLGAAHTTPYPKAKRRKDAHALPPQKTPRKKKKKKTIKEAMDGRFGGRWHAVAGRGFAFAVTHQELLHVYVGGSVGVLLWNL